jgi:hypothetical protein
MDSKELRIGNYVKWGGAIAEVVSICKIDRWSIELQAPDKKVQEVALDDISPVALSLELLMNKCGFDSLGKLKLGIDHHRYCLMYQDGYMVLSNQNYEPLIQFWDVRYLHRLQNLYYALKAIELPVKLK